MKIELIAFPSDYDVTTRLPLTAAIINNSKADVVVFPGWTLSDTSDVAELEKLLTNHSVTALLEAENYQEAAHPDEIAPELPNYIFLWQDGEMHDMHTRQQFADSVDINRSRDCAEKLMDELENRRAFTVGDKAFRVLICGENNILKNVQGEGNRAEFRFKDDHALADRFRRLLAETDVVLNPSHTPMGNQGKLARRRELLSADGRSYFMTCNYWQPSTALHKTVQYALANSSLLSPLAESLSSPSQYISRTYQI